MAFDRDFWRIGELHTAKRRWLKDIPPFPDPRMIKGYMRFADDVLAYKTHKDYPYSSKAAWEVLFGRGWDVLFSAGPRVLVQWYWAGIELDGGEPSIWAEHGSYRCPAYRNGRIYMKGWTPVADEYEGSCNGPNLIAPDYNSVEKMCLREGFDVGDLFLMRAEFSSSVSYEGEYDAEFNPEVIVHLPGFEEIKIPPLTPEVLRQMLGENYEGEITFPGLRRDGRGVGQ